MKIAVLGYTDKRPVLYSILKVLQSIGDVVMVTDNRHFRRLVEDGSSLGHLLNIMICVTDATPDEVWAEIGYASDDFDHVVYDVRETLPEDADMFIHVMGSQLDDGEAEFLECIDEYKKVKLMYDGKPIQDKTAINLPVSMQVISNTELIENKKILNPYKDKKFNKLMAKLVAPLIKVREREALTLLNRR